MSKHTLTFVLMDAPFESARTTTAFRLLHAALDSRLRRERLRIRRRRRIVVREAGSTRQCSARPRRRAGRSSVEQELDRVAAWRTHASAARISTG